jgi:predicted nucleic acid-binding protein
VADRYLADASVLIDQLRGVPAAVAFLAPLLNQRLVVLHPAVHAEVLSGARDRRHLVGLDLAMASLRGCAIKGADMNLAIDLVRTHTLSHGIGWPDCLIAATCLRLGLPLVTLNDRHFKPIRGLSVIRPY